MFAVGELTVIHASEQVEVLLDTAVTVWAVRTRLGQRATVFANLIGAQGVDIGDALLDERNR